MPQQPHCYFTLLCRYWSELFVLSFLVLGALIAGAVGYWHPLFACVGYLMTLIGTLIWAMSVSLKEKVSALRTYAITLLSLVWITTAAIAVLV